jgi:phenylacetate-CoA ligase
MKLQSRRSKDDSESAAGLSRWLDSVTDTEVRDMQWEAVCRVWEDCTTDVPYYRDLVLSGRAPPTLQTWDNLMQIPVLDRRTIRERQAEFRRISCVPDETRMTGGSTGVPVKIGVWKGEAELHRVAKLVLWQRSGYEPSHRLFLLWGHFHLLGTGVRGKLNHLVRTAKDRLLGYKRVNAYSLSPEKCRSIARDLIRFRPFGLIGYASALDYFLRTTESFHDQFQNLGLGFVLPAGEMPPHSDSYELLARTFKCPVLEEYAGVEIGQIAMRDGGELFRVFDHLNYVESEDEGNSQTPGRVLITSLFERYVPLIRYAPGDLISGVRRLEHGHVREFARVDGRSHDSITLPTGNVLHSMAIFHCIHQESGVVNIQMALTNEGPRLRLVTTDLFDEASEARIRGRLADVAPELRDIPVDRVPDVATTRAGKRRWISDERSSQAGR